MPDDSTGQRESFHRERDKLRAFVVNSSTKTSGKYFLVEISHSLNTNYIYNTLYIHGIKVFNIYIYIRIKYSKVINNS